jgi:hypothetical protein
MVASKNSGRQVATTSRIAQRENRRENARFGTAFPGCGARRDAITKPLLCRLSYGGDRSSIAIAWVYAIFSDAHPGYETGEHARSNRVSNQRQNESAEM